MIITSQYRLSHIQIQKLSSETLNIMNIMNEYY
jgi:hypothetical protein